METNNGMFCGSSASTTQVGASLHAEEEMEVRRGPWTVEEDLLLINYIENHGEGRWNSLAHSSGLKRTGKSCRLRWLNYLRPDVRRGNITPEEQLLILQLHSCWGNRWSKIAQYLPGRTDNEIKNYWRTRVQKQAKQLRCDVNSKKFKDVMRYLWMPRLLERIRAAGSYPTVPICQGSDHGQPKPIPEEYSSSSVLPPVSDYFVDSYTFQDCDTNNEEQRATIDFNENGWSDVVASPIGYPNEGLVDADHGYWGGEMGENLWNADDIWYSELK